MIVRSCLLCCQENICSLDRNLHPFSCILTANHQLLIDPISQRCACKWCCLSVLSRCLSLCNVNTASDSWLLFKLWGHYKLTGSLFTLCLPLSISSTPLCYLFPFQSIPSDSLGIILFLDAYMKRFGGKHTATGQCLVCWICRKCPMNMVKVVGGWF